MLIRPYHRPVPIGDVNAPGVSRNYRGRRLSGLGGPAGANSCAEYIQNAFAGLPPLSMFGPNPGPEVLAAAYINSPGMTPAQLAQSVTLQLAQEYCGAVNAEISAADPNAAAACTDGGAACAAAAAPQWEEYYNSIPSAVLATSSQAYTPPSPTPVAAPSPIAAPQTSPATNTQGNVLNPPTPAPAIPPGSLVQNQIGSGTTLGPGGGGGASTQTTQQTQQTQQSSNASNTSATTTSIPTWAIVAAAAVVGVLLISGRGR
jgi:hypothetical protein